MWSCGFRGVSEGDLRINEALEVRIPAYKGGSPTLGHMIVSSDDPTTSISGLEFRI